MTTYLIEAMDMFERPNIYGEPDDAQRWLFFCDALLATVPRWVWQPDVLHLHDWHTAFVVARLRAAPSHPLNRAGVVYTIHNLALRGELDDAFLAANDLRLPRLPPMQPGELRNAMALGIAGADAISTVSETYAREILTPELGAGLDGLLRRRAGDLMGIVNGIDMEELNPATDRALAAPFSAADPAGKLVNKAALQHECGLTPDSSIPVISMVNRLYWQKGPDIAADGLAGVLSERRAQFVMLGSGEAQYEEQARALARLYPGQVSVTVGIDLPYAQRVYAGSDLFLMPSRYEPCGLGQLIAMRYGSIPVVHRTGGLADTVIDDDEQPDAGVGFVFDQADGPSLEGALRRALRAYRSPERWAALVQRAMVRDSSWTAAAARYEELYRRALSRVALAKPW